MSDGDYLSHSSRATTDPTIISQTSIDDDTSTIQHDLTPRLVTSDEDQNWPEDDDDDESFLPSVNAGNPAPTVCQTRTPSEQSNSHKSTSRAMYDEQFWDSFDRRVDDTERKRVAKQRQKEEQAEKRRQESELQDQKRIAQQQKEEELTKKLRKEYETKRALRMKQLEKQCWEGFQRARQQVKEEDERRAREEERRRANEEQYEQRANQWRRRQQFASMHAKENFMRAVLGVARNSSLTVKEIKAAYKREAKVVHPDRNPTDPLAKKKMQMLNECYHDLLERYSGR